VAQNPQGILEVIVDAVEGVLVCNGNSEIDAAKDALSGFSLDRKIGGVDCCEDVKEIVF
jgi:hypothetical protein